MEKAGRKGQGEIAENHLMERPFQSSQQRVERRVVFVGGRYQASPGVGIGTEMLMFSPAKCKAHSPNCARRFTPPAGRPRVAQGIANASEAVDACPHEYL